MFSMKKLLHLVASALILTLASVERAEAGTIYDAVNDFSITSNPNGVWSYGSLSSLAGGNFAYFTSSGNNNHGLDAWVHGASVPNFESIAKNVTNADVVSNQGHVPPNLLNLDGESGIADVRWTAPTTGVYNISGLFQRLDYTNTPVSVRVLLNGTALFSADNFATYNGQEVFNFSNLTLAAGSVLDFAEGAPQYNNDSTGLSVTISSTVPEPSALALCFIGGTISLAVAKVRRKRTA